MKGKRIAAFLLALSLVVSQEGLGRLTVQAQSPQEQTEQGPTETSEQKDDQGAVKDVKIDPAGSQPAEQAVSGESANEQNADEAAAEGTNDSQAAAKETGVEETASQSEANGQKEAVQTPEEAPDGNETGNRTPEATPDGNETDGQMPAGTLDGNESNNPTPEAAPDGNETGSQTPAQEQAEDDELLPADEADVEEAKEENSSDELGAKEPSAPKADRAEDETRDKEPSKNDVKKRSVEADETDVNPLTEEAPQQEPQAQEESGDFQAAKAAFTELLADHAVYALVYQCEETDLFDQPGWNSRKLTSVRGGYQVRLTDAELYEETLWYRVEALVGGVTYSGYLADELLVSADEGLANWKASYQPNTAAGGARAMRAGTDLSKFPASYQPLIQNLLNAHPNWTFVPMDTGLDWATVIQNEMTPARNLVPQNYMDTWKDSNEILSAPYWVQASESIVRYYMDPRNFLNETSVFQFELLAFNSGNHTEAGVKTILKNTFMADKVIEGTDMTYAQAFMRIGKELNVSPYHLASRVRQEQGVNGDSNLISGTYPGYEGLYNYYNIQAAGATMEEIIANGLTEAREEGWDSRFKALYGGSSKIASRYIAVGQNTLYLQKFDVDDSDGQLFWKQYMQNLLAADNEGKQVQKGYAQMGVLNNSFVFRVPIYDNMPASACKMPTDKLETPSLKASVKNLTTVNLSWSEVAGAQGYQIYRCETQTGDYKKIKTITSVGTTSYSETADLNKTYYYKVRGYKTLGGATAYSGFSPIQSISTNITKPTISSLKTSGYTKATLKWNKVSGAAGYRIYRKEENGSYQAIATVEGASNVSYTDKTLLPNKSYSYKIKTYILLNGSKKYSSYSAVKSISTTMPKTQWKSLKATSYTKASVKWNKVSGVDGYVIYRKEGNGSYQAVKTITGADTISYTDKTLLPNKSYSYKLRSYVLVNGSKKYSSYSAVKSITTTMPKMQWKSLKATSYTKASVKWNEVSGVDGYTIYRRQGKSGSYKAIKSVSGADTTSCTDKTLLPNQTYYYKLRSYVLVNGSKKYSPYSSAKSVSTKMATPSLVSASVAGNKTISVKWEAEKWVSGYRIYRANSSGGKYTLVKDIANSKTTSYKDSGLKANGTYKYKVRAYVLVNGSKKYSSYSNVIMGKTKLTTPSVSEISASSATSAKLGWNKVVSATGYQIYRATSYNGKYKKVKTITKNATIQYTNKSLNPNQTYFYKVRAYSKVGKTTTYSKFSAVTSITPGMDAPEITTVSSISTTSAKLKWDQVKGAQGYRLYRADKPGGTYQLIKTLSGEKKNTYTNTGLKKGKTYYYKVRSYVKVGNSYKYSAYSDVWSVQTKKG